jgi:arylsulfatase A-like enzyme
MRNTLLGFALFGTLLADGENKPNIILVMADDLGWGDVGFNGNTLIKTPNLDKMASEGIRFTRFYSASAVCSPTRASVLTGRNPSRMGVFNANVGILRPEEITLPELLKETGYITAHFGKWHLGSLTASENDANRGKPGNTREYNPPIFHGYDECFVTESKVPTWDPMKKPLKKATANGWPYLKPAELFAPYGTHYWDIKGNKITENLEGDDSRVIMDRVIPFIDHSVKKEAPFLAVVWFHAPHLPCVAGPKYVEMYKNEDTMMQNYAGCITALDEQIGRLRTHLARLKIDKQTILFFCSDNGPEKNTPGSSGMFRDRKRSLHEGGIRVPSLIVWPQKVPKPFVSDIACVTSDYLPTIVDILKISSQKLKYHLDGQSLLPIIEQKAFVRRNPIGFTYQNQIALSDSIFKLYSKPGEYELYNLKEDPFEKNNLAAQKSDIIQKMKTKYEYFYLDLEKSFLGKEYGTLSFNRMKQEWKGIFETNKEAAE